MVAKEQNIELLNKGNKIYSQIRKKKQNQLKEVKFDEDARRYILKYANELENF